MIDRASVLAKADLVEIVSRYVQLKKNGKEWVGRCPFHDERTPSFYVNAQKGFVHCFGCGAHYDAIGFLMEKDGLGFLQACEAITGSKLPAAERKPIKRAQDISERFDFDLWVPIMPPIEAPAIISGVETKIWNPKRGRDWRMTPVRADEYRSQSGRLLGYVLRVEFEDGTKVTPQVTWCVGPNGGDGRWCSRPFLDPRPLCGLFDLTQKPDAPALIFEGEKCRAAGDASLPMYAAITWPGGSNGVARADWSPLAGRDIVLWPDADNAGRKAMLGEERRDGTIIPGVAQFAKRAGCGDIRMVSTDGMPKGWDIADAVSDGWSARQIAAWAASRIVDVDVVVDDRRRVA